MARNGSMSNLSFRGMAFWLKLRERFLNARQSLLDAGVSEGQVVLDYGCGIGTYTLPAAEIVGTAGRVHALDIQPLALKTVERRVREAGLTNVETILSARKTGLPEAGVDVVLLYDVLHAVEDPQALLQELHRVLKPGGRLSLKPDHLSPEEAQQVVEGRGLFSSLSRGGELLAFCKAPAGVVRPA